MKAGNGGDGNNRENHPQRQHPLMEGINQIHMLPYPTADDVLVSVRRLCEHESQSRRLSYSILPRPSRSRS
jgi:hypothetical protein